MCPAARRVTFCLTLAAWAPRLPSLVAPPAPARPLVARLDQALRREVAAGFSGAVLVALRGRVLLDAGYGRVHGQALRRDSRFWIASIGKQFTSAAVLRAQEQGRLRLEDPLSRFFPEAPPDKAGISLLQLLTHQSGLPQQYVADGLQERAEAVQRILAQPLVSAPGAGFVYSNDNYQLAAAVLELVTGGSYEDYVGTELLRPAGLTDTGFAGTRAARWVAPTRGPRPARLWQRQWGAIGCGGMLSTTRDLQAWYGALRSNRVLQPASVSRLFEPLVTIQEGAAGLGWFTSTRGGQRCVFTRGNDDSGANGLIYAYPEKEALVVILSHAGEKDDGVSFSRSAHAALEPLLLAEPER